MKISSPIEEKKARIEIIPLIDIMFFLLACFMAISLSMIQMRGMRIALPTAASGQPDTKNDFVSITIDAAHGIYIEKDEIHDHAEITRRIKTLYEANNDVRIYIRADKDASHGEVVTVLDLVRAAGVQKVAFEIKAQTVTAPTADAPAVPPAPPAPPVAPKPQ